MSGRRMVKRKPDVGVGQIESRLLMESPAGLHRHGRARTGSKTACAPGSVLRCRAARKVSGFPAGNSENSAMRE